MILLDTETTNLTAPEAAPLDQQPHIMEFAAIKLDDKSLLEKDRLDFLCNPRVLIPPESVKITGINDAMVAKRPPLVTFFGQLVEFFLGERIVIAHNLAFDIGVMKYEFMRLGRLTAFPYPPIQICTVEKTINLKGHRLALGDLHLFLTGKPHSDAHRAMPDVEALVRVVRELKKKGMLEL